MSKDWRAWHDAYDRPDSRLSARLAVVRRRVADALTASPPGPIRVVSLCAGQGRDLLGVLVAHPRRLDVVARLVEIDERNVALAQATVAELGLPGIEVVTGDAARTDAYLGAVPAEVVMTCGIFGNITDPEIEATIDELPGFCAPEATVIWTRGAQQPDRLTNVDGWFRAAGFETVSVEVGGDDPPFGVGVHRLVAEPRPLRPGLTLFRFRPDRQPDLDPEP